MTKFVHDVENGNSINNQIKSFASEQSNTLTEINMAVENFDQIIQQNAGMVDETTAAKALLSKGVAQLAAASAGF